MDTTDNNETPKRRLADQTPDATIDWTSPGAPAVPVASNVTRPVPLRAVASMCVKADGISLFATPAAQMLEPGHYMLLAPGAQLAGMATGASSSGASADRAAEAAQPAITDDKTAFAADVRAYFPTTEDLLIDAYWKSELGKIWRAARSRPAATSGDELPTAWAHEDGRVVSAATKATAERDGGAMRSSLSGYTIPLYPSAAVSAATKPAETVIPAPRDLATQCMADCMDMVRQELIEAGVIDASVPPMMVANAVIAHIARQAQPTDRDAVLEEAAVLCDQQSNEPECPERAGYCADAIRALKGKSGSEGVAS